MINDFKKALEGYVKAVEQACEFDKGLYGAAMVEVEEGRRYAKVVTTRYGHRSVHTFVDTTTGDILKAGTWKAPAKNGVRGTIFATDNGRSVIIGHGANYLR